MTHDVNNIGPGEPSDPNAELPNQPVVVAEDIVSVNRKGASNNRAGKAIFILVVSAVLIGGLAWMGQDYLNKRKAQMKANSGPKAPEEQTQVFNPEKTGSTQPKARLGSESGAVPPSQAAVKATQLGAPRDDGIRPMRGPDGKVMVNPQGRAMGVDKNGQIVEVPAITAMGDEPARKPLPGEGADGKGQGGGQAQQKPPSRYAGSLYVGEQAIPSGSNAAGNSDGSGPGPGSTGSGNSSTNQGSAPRAATSADQRMQQVADILKNAGLGGAQGTRPGAASLSPTTLSPSEPARPGTVGSSLYSSATPVAVAKKTTDQNLMLPKGRQADCVLTGRIIDEVPGFTSCVLVQNMYSDNGRVLLLERGSELTGEYGTTNQLGLERLFVTWTRLKTPQGVEIDLASPGSDRLGTSGVPGHLDNRWGARVGAALLLSFVKDITVALIARGAGDSSGGGTNVTIAQPSYTNTTNASTALVEEVIKQTMKIRPRLTINEGDRVSVYVARDLDFSQVYGLKTAAAADAAVR